MIKEIIANLAIIISALHLASKGSENSIEKNFSILIKVLYGLFAAGVGIILMEFSIRHLGEVIIDLRPVAIIIVTTFAGGVPGLVASVLIGVARLFISFSQIAQYTAMTYIILGVVIFFVDLKIKNKSILNRLWIIYISVMVPLSINFHINVDENNGLLILLFIWGYTAMGTIIAYRFEIEIQTNKKNAKMLEKLSNTDYLTNLNNRYSFDNAIVNYYNDKDDYVLLLLDIDKFKEVNDTYGHDVGDRILRQVATTLINTTIQNSVPFRLGGDEFAILIKGKYLDKEIIDLIKGIKMDILFNELRVSQNESIKIKVSIGSSSTVENTVFPTVEKMYKKADIDLYSDKH